MNSCLLSMRSYQHKMCRYFMSCMSNSFTCTLYTFSALIIDKIQHYTMSHMCCQHLSKIPHDIKHKMLNSDSFCNLSRIECILMLLNFSNIPLDMMINNFYRVSKNPQDMMCIDLIKDCMFYMDWDIFSISSLISLYTFLQHIEAHIIHIEWSCYWLSRKLSLGRSWILLYKKHTSHCQDITNMDLNISHILCDNFLYNTFLDINFYIHQLTGHKNILICMLNIKCLMYKFNMDWDRRNIGEVHRHCNCPMDKFIRTF